MRACAAVVVAVAVVGLLLEDDPSELSTSTIATTPMATAPAISKVARVGERRRREYVVTPARREGGGWSAVPRPRTGADAEDPRATGAAPRAEAPDALLRAALASALMAAAALRRGGGAGAPGAGGRAVEGAFPTSTGAAVGTDDRWVAPAGRGRSLGASVADGGGGGGTGARGMAAAAPATVAGAGEPPGA